MDVLYGSVYYRGPAIIRRARPRSLCARCGGIAQDVNLVASDRSSSSDRGPCGLSIEVDGREGRRVQRRHSSSGREGRSNRGRSHSYVIATSNGQKVGNATTYREYFRSPPPEEFKSKIIRSLPRSPITETLTSSSRQKKLATSSTADPSSEVTELPKQTDCSVNIISMLDADKSQEIPRPKKGKGNSTIAAKSHAHHPLWTEGSTATENAPAPRRPVKGFAHQPLWGDNAASQPTKPRRPPSKGLMHQPLWSDGGTPQSDPAPPPRRTAKGLAHQPLWADSGTSAADPPPISRRAATRTVSESETLLPPAGIKTQPPSSLTSLTHISSISPIS